MNLNDDRHPDKDRAHEVSSHTLILRAVFLLSGGDIQGAVGQHLNPVVPGDGLPLPGPRDGWRRLSSCQTIQYDFGTGVDDRVHWLEGNNGSTLQSQAHAALHHPSGVGGHTRVVPGVFIHSAVDGQGAVAQLPDSVATFNVHTLSAPLDGWHRVSSHLTVQDCVTSEWLNPV